MDDVRECKRCGGDVFGTGSYQLCDQCLDIVLFGDEKKSDHELTRFPRLSSDVIEANTRDLRRKHRVDAAAYSRIDRTFKRLKEWLTRPLERQRDERADERFAVPTHLRLDSAFVSYSRDGSQRAFEVARYLRVRGIDTFTYTEPGAAPPPVMAREEIERLLREKVARYSSIIVILTPRSLGISYVTQEILAGFDGDRPVFAMLTVDVVDDPRQFESATFVPTVSSLDRFFPRRDA
jgi:hypothetical protein